MDSLISSALMMSGSGRFHYMSSLLCSFSLIFSGSVMPVAPSTTSMATATGPGPGSCPPAGIRGQLAQFFCMPAHLPGHGTVILYIL